VAEDETQPTSGHDRAIDRLQLAGVVLIVFATIGARIVDKVTSVSNWMVYGVAVIVVTAVLIVGAIVVGRVEGRPARDVATGAVRATKSDLKKQVARLRRQ
jgi:hypothetical protein